MKRWLIILLEIAVIIVFLRSSFAQYMLGDARTEVSGWFDKVGDYAENQQLLSLRNDLAPHMQILTEDQQAYMDELIRDKERMRSFSANYCHGTDINPYVFGDTLNIVCSHFLSSRLLFPAEKT